MSCLILNLENKLRHRNIIKKISSYRNTKKDGWFELKEELKLLSA